MKLRDLILNLTALLIFSGCSFAVSTLEPVYTPPEATPTPNIMPRLDPSPTPSNNPYPLAFQVTDLSVYIDQDGGYCFAYPPRFMPADFAGVRGPDLDESLTPLFVTFEVEFKPSNAEFTARGEAEIFLKDFTVVEIDSLTWNQIMVGGEWGWIVEPVPTMGAWRFVFVQHNGYLYRLSYWPVDIPIARADVDELTQTTLGSFAFTR
jgi:hypothetical protein